VNLTQVKTMVDTQPISENAAETCTKKNNNVKGVHNFRPSRVRPTNSAAAQDPLPASTPQAASGAGAV